MVVLASLPFVFKKTDGDIYGPEGLMCTIRSVYPKLQFFLHLLPVCPCWSTSGPAFLIEFNIDLGGFYLIGGLLFYHFPCPSGNYQYQGWNQVDAGS
jgi:hypothetical protein